MRPLLTFFVGLLYFAPVATQYTPDWESIDSRPLPPWYDEAKFGIFIHWGVFSVPSFGCPSSSPHFSTTPSEWYWWSLDAYKAECMQEFHNKTYGPEFTYPEFAPMFTASLFDPDEWAELFAEAGAKYVILTSKHHDGFTNWKSAQSWNWNSVETGPHIDIVGHLTESVRSVGLRMGLYHSLFEWFNPLYLEDLANNGTTNYYIAQVLMPMLYDIVNTYEPDIVWADGSWDFNSTYWESTEFLAWLYNDSPVKDYVLVNDRWGADAECHHGGYFTCEDRYNPGHKIDHKWENAFTIDSESWGYNRRTNISGYLTAEHLVDELVITVSCGGNLLLNVGPASDGTIHPIFQERLLQVGSWLKVNGDAIYSTTPWRAQNETSTDVWYTSKGSSVFAIALSWPSDNVLRLSEPVPTSKASAQLLGYGELQFTYTNGEMQITLPNIPISKLPCDWAWTIQLEAVN